MVFLSYSLAAIFSCTGLYKLRVYTHLEEDIYGDMTSGVKAVVGVDTFAVDMNSNGQVTIQEAKDAGYAMPIYSDHWLYPYMDDRDGQVGK